MKSLFIKLILICSMSLPTGALAEVGFSKELLLSKTDATHAINPRVCTGSGKAVYVVWSDMDPNGGDSIFFTRSLDGGLSFDDKREIEKSAATEVSISDPQIGVDSKGTVCIVYSMYDNEKSQFALIMRKSENDGSSFDTETIFTQAIGGIVSGQNIAFFGSDLRITDDGIFYMWSGYREIFLARRMNGDDDFEIIELEEGKPHPGEFPFKLKTYPSFAIDAHDTIHAVWHEALIEKGTIQARFDLYTAKLENDREAFSESKMLATCNAFAGFVIQPSVAVTLDDTLLITWYGAPAGFINETDAASYTMSSMDGGDTFSDPLEITFGIDSSGQNRKMIVDQNDVLHFLYLMHSDGTLHYTKSHDSCNSFDNSMQVGSLSAMADMHVDEKKAKVYVVWEDPQTSGVYFSRQVDKTDEDIPPDDAPKPKGGGGGGGGCFIHSARDE